MMVSSTTPSDEPRCPPVDGHGPDDRLADVGGQVGQLALVHAAQVGGSVEVGQGRHVGRMLRAVVVVRSLRAMRIVNLFLAGRQFLGELRAAGTP